MFGRIYLNTSYIVCFYNGGYDNHRSGPWKTAGHQNFSNHQTRPVINCEYVKRNMHSIVLPPTLQIVAHTIIAAID